MKKTDFMTMTAAMMLATSACVGPEKAAQTDGPIIGKQEVTVKDGRMTPETLWAMGRIGSSCVSPDGKRIAYTVSYYSVKENKSHLVIYVMNADGSGNQLLTTTAASEGEPAWIKNGSKLAFLAPDADGNSQIWEMNPDGSERVQLSSFAGGIDGFKFSPDESKVLFISQVKYGERTVDKYPDLDKASGMVIDDLMYKHWDEWVQTVPHPFVAPFAGNKVGEAQENRTGICYFYRFGHLPVQPGNQADPQSLQGRRYRQEHGLRHQPAVLPQRRIHCLAKHGARRIRKRPQPPLRNGFEERQEDLRYRSLPVGRRQLLLGSGQPDSLFHRCMACHQHDSPHKPEG